MIDVTGVRATGARLMLVAVARMVLADRCATIAMVLEAEAGELVIGLGPREPGSLLPSFTRRRASARVQRRANPESAGAPS
jgi:hypothetical protein